MISVVVPAFNEQDTVPVLHQRLSAAAAAWGEEYEILLVDDGSSDGTFALCAEIAARDPRLRVVSFSRNFGHQAAVTAGLRQASGDVVAIIDADLQDPPEELHRFIAKCREGYDVVYAIRQKRKESALKRASYFLYYRILSSLATIDIPLDAGDFCVMSRRAVDTLNALPERNRFVRGLRSWIGFRHIGLPYERQARAAGAPKYTLGKLMNLALDGIINFSYRPLRVITLVGFLVGGLAFLMGILFLVQYVGDITIQGYNPRQARGWTSLILSILFLAGTQLVALGVLGEYMGRLFEETKQRPMYIIARTANLGSALPSAAQPAASDVAGQKPADRA